VKSRWSTRATVLLGLAFALLGAVLVPVLAFGETPDIGNTPETAKTVSWTYAGTGTIKSTPTTDTDDVYRVYLTAGKRFSVFTDEGGYRVNVDLFLSSAAATGTYLKTSENDGADEYITYDVRKSGYYFVDVWANDDAPASAAGSYAISFWQEAVPYSFTAFNVPAKAKKNTNVYFSAWINPMYLRTGKPMTFVVQKKQSSGWVTKYNLAAGGLYTRKFLAAHTLSAGTWRVQAQFKDVDHSRMKTVWKTITVK
jgi:hypothetical protein